MYSQLDRLKGSLPSLHQTDFQNDTLLQKMLDEKERYKYLEG